MKFARDSILRLIVALVAWICGLSAAASAAQVVYVPPVIPPGVCHTAVPTPRDDWLASVQAKFDRAQGKHFDVVFDGDSYIASWEGHGAGLQTWNARYAPLGAINFGISGDMVQSVLWRLQHGQLDGIDPKLVVLMIGTNNLQFDPPEKIAHGIQVLVDEYLKDAPHANLLLLGIFPRGTLSSDPFRPKIAEVNQQIASLADGKRVVYLDIGTTFLASDGSLRPEMFAADRIHPNDKLYEAWADVMQPEIGKLLGLPDSPNGAGVSPATSK